VIAFILQRTEKKGDYLRREPGIAIDVDEPARWIDDGWTLVTFTISLVPNTGISFMKGPS
jgi:hypothetical protein